MAITFKKCFIMIYRPYTEAEKFVKIVAKLNTTGDEPLLKVAASYQKWLVGIVSGLAKNQTGKRFQTLSQKVTPHIQRIINVAYGYRIY